MTDKTLELTFESGSRIKLVSNGSYKMSMFATSPTGKEYPEMIVYLCNESGSYRTHFERRYPVGKIKRVSGLDYRYVGESNNERFLPIRDFHKEINNFMDESYEAFIRKNKNN